MWILNDRAWEKKRNITSTTKINAAVQYCEYQMQYISMNIFILTLVDIYNRVKFMRTASLNTIWFISLFFFDSFTACHKTEVIKNTLNPTWKPFQIPVAKLCNGDYDRYVSKMGLEWVIELTQKKSYEDFIFEIANWLHRDWN